MKRNQVVAAAYAVLLFLSGAAAGVLAHRYYSVTTVNANGRNPEADRKRYISETQSRLGLDPAQVAQLEGIMHDTRAKMRSVRDSYNPAMLQIKKDHMERVKAMLRPEQLPKYEKLVAEREQRAHDQEEHDHGGGHGPR